MNRLVIFGERPGPNTDPLRPLFPHTSTGAAANLIRMLGISQEQYLQLPRYNVCQTAEEPTIGNRSRVARIMFEHTEKHPQTHYLFLGKEALRAAPQRYRHLNFGEKLGQVMVIPHTSGRNRFYNSERNKRMIIRALREFAGTI